MSKPSQPILVIDDNEDVRDLYLTFFAHRGYRVVAARDGREALQLLGDGVRPSVILLDYHMPGMNGRAFRLAQIAAGLALDAPLILYSADVAVDPSGLGAASVVDLPVDLNELEALVRGLLTRH